MDRVTPEERSVIMSHIRSKNTKPEIILRKYLHHRGFRYRIHSSQLPGHPDIVLPKYNAVIFVHGCFWHGHEGCKLSHIPKSRSEYWQAKFQRNIDRDKKNIKELETQGWRILIVWECEIRKSSTKFEEVVAWLKDNN